MSNGKTPLLPFEEMPLSCFSMYDNIPYVRDKDLCSEEAIKMVSGNVVKYYTTKQREGKVLLDSNGIRPKIKVNEE